MLRASFVFDGEFLASQSTTFDCPHQYIDRRSGEVVTERFIADPMVAWLYSRVRETHPYLFRLATQHYGSKLLAYLNYDAPIVAHGGAFRGLINDLGIDEAECLAPFKRSTKLREVFERQIRFWEVRPLAGSPTTVVSPSDSRVLFGRFSDDDSVPIKEKFFTLNELIGMNKIGWQLCFGDGSYAIFRLTPEKYHYNHVPVSGRVVDTYEIDGDFHSCNPSAIVRMVTPYSKNRRCVTIIDTDVEDGTNVGFVAMIEVVALMIGEVVQCYCEEAYEPASPLKINQFAKRGSVKSLFRPGSSTVVLLFERDRVLFDHDLMKNARRRDVQSRFTHFFGEQIVETDVAVRSSIGKAVPSRSKPKLSPQNLVQLEAI